MGKTRRNRKRSRPNNNPTGLPSVQDISLEELEAGEPANLSKHETAIPTVLDQLQSPDEENKLFGLQTLASVFDSPAPALEIIGNRVVKVAGPLLIDPSSAVRNAAAGALRNLSAAGDAEICDLLIEEDVMTPLSSLLQQYAGNWQPKQEGDNETDTFIQAVHLLWNLCESSSVAVKYFNSNNLMSVLVKCLDSQVFGMETAIVVSQCLQTVTEENPIAINQIQTSQPLVMKLFKLEGSEPSVLYLRTLAAGLLLNLNYGKVSYLTPGILTQIMTTLSTTLEVDHRKALNDFTSNYPLNDMNNASEPTVDDKQIESSILHLLDAQKTAIEILANLTSGDDTECEPMDQDSSSDDMLSDSACADDDVDPTSVEEEVPLSIPPEIHEGIVSHGIVDKVWSKAVYPAENVCEILKERPETKVVLRRIATLRCRALLCLSNLFSAVDMAELGGPLYLYKLWMKIGNIVFQEADADDLKLLEAATAAMRSALQKLAQCKALCFTDFSEADMQLFFNGAHKCKEPSVRANLVRVIGNLGMILQYLPQSGQQFLKSIGKFLLDTTTKESELWVVAEVLDTLMDVFSEDETDQAAAEIGLVDKLKILVPTLKHKLKSQKKCLGEHYLVVTTVNANLMRFIKYKGKRLETHHRGAQQNGH